MMISMEFRDIEKKEQAKDPKNMKYFSSKNHLMLNISSRNNL